MMERKRKANGQVYSKKAKKTRKNKKSTGADEEEEEEELFSWEEYLKKTCSKAVPQSTFKHVHDPVGQGFVPGMKVEAFNRNSEQGETYWVATIVTVSGPLLLLRYDGSEEDRSGDFWCDATSEDLQPIGWCARTNHMLLPPESIRHKESNWAKFLTNDLKDKSAYAPENLFHKQPGQEDEGVLPPGTKVELLNKDDPLSYWVACVVESYGMRLQLRYEGMEDEDHDVWIYYLSERVHNLGWGIQHSLVLRPPPVLTVTVQDLAPVTDKILGTCHSSAKPTSPLNSKHAKLPREHNLTVGMKLEAIHPGDPSCVCVATVSRILSPVYFKVQIDSLISCSDKKLVFCSHANSRSIFPVGWCESNNITLTPPPGYHALPFSWDRYLKWTCSVAAPTDLFDLTVPEHGFELDLKMEAVDQSNPSVVTVGTVTQVVGRTVWIHLDGIQDDAVEHIYDVESYDLLPAGWGSTHGYPLQTPRITFKDTTDRNRISTRLRVTRQRQKQINGSLSETLDSEEKKKSKEVKPDKKSDPKLDKKQDKAPDVTPEKKESKKQENNLASKFKGKKLQIKRPFTLKVRFSPRKNDVDNKPASSSVSTQSSAKIKPYTPKAKTSLITPEASASQEKLEPVTSSVDLVDLTDEDLPLDKVPDKGKEKGEAPQHSVCIHLKASCKTGPYLNRSKLKNAVTLMGPHTPDAALKKLLECIVNSSHRSRQVLDILSNERDKKTFWSILQTLHIKLKFCPNLFTLRKVLICSLCDKPAKDLAREPLDLTAHSTRPTRSTSPIQSEAKPSSAPTTTSPRNTPGQPRPVNSPPVVSKPTTSRATTGRPVVSKPTAGRTGGRPPKHPVKTFNEPDKPAPKSARRSGLQSPTADELQTVHENEATPQSPDVSSVAFVMPSGSHISSWNVTDVVEFIRSTDCSQFADVFQEQEIDGKALMLLSLDEIHKCLDVTLGPAIKLHDYVQKLRKRPR